MLASTLVSPRCFTAPARPFHAHTATWTPCWRQQLPQSVSPVLLAPRQNRARPTSWALSHSAREDSETASTNGLPQQQQHAEQALRQGQTKVMGRHKKGGGSPERMKRKKEMLAEDERKPTDIRQAIASAYYLGKELDLKSLRRHFQHALLHVAPDYCLLSYTEHPADAAPEQDEGQHDEPGADAGALEGTEWPSAEDVNKLVPLEGSMAVFSSGSVVFYSSRADSKEREEEEQWQEEWLKALESFVSRDSILDGISYNPGPGPEPPSGGLRQRLGTEEVKLQVGGSDLKKVFTKGPDLVILQQWDLGTTEILSRVLAQSVAIDVYTSTVDQMLWRLEGNLDRLRKATHQGPLQKMAQKVSPSFLQQLAHKVASKISGGSPSSSWQPDIDQGELAILLTDASTLEIRLISKLGLMDKSHTPWESDKHDAAWQGLRSYFDIEKRQGQVEKKMGKITTKTNDMLETRRSTQTHYIENVITILIMIEIVMSLLFHFFDGGVTENTAATATRTGQLVQQLGQLAEVTAQQQETLSKAIESLQAMQNSLPAQADPAVLQSQQQANEVMAKAIQTLSELQQKGGR